MNKKRKALRAIEDGRKNPMKRDGTGKRKPRPDGYVVRAVNYRHVLEHILTWEKHFGAVPIGYEIHHKDFNRANNQIVNLEILTKLEHSRLHHGYVQDTDGEWLKRCNCCDEYKLVSVDFYTKAQGRWTDSVCKPCKIRQVAMYKKARRACHG